LADICKAEAILPIVDDIQAGCGRTGSFFSFEGMDVVPDVVLLSKALSGFGAPLSVVLLRRDLDIWRPGEHTSTFRGNNLAFVGGSAALEEYWRDDCFASALAQRAHGFTDLLASAVCIPGRIALRGRGMMVGLHFSEPGMATKCSQLLFGRRIMAETCGENDQVLKFLPPLTIKAEDLEFAIRNLEEVLGEALFTRV
jgi:diaminobutyrate-2-oxoglutarate transaminase